MRMSRFKAKKRGRRGAPRRTFSRKVCRFCMDKVESIDYKDVERVARYVTERGKILPSRLSGTCAGHQRVLGRAIKRARFMALLPYSTK